ncbi:hypothetical protein NUW58_g8408 [Xylaria curta]|uniref:Uncharacterized protein n=1 Tax=Xylaria curta TaxID=42375 RepID=A0ACC1N7P2_9PEZI|nr:hypothetical protein NUW58_g8408 [Xylaria curta]
MLCRHCERSLQTTAKRLSLIRQKDLDFHYRWLADSLHHISLDTFYKSIKDGCFICRHLWASLRRKLGKDGNIEGLIPPTFENFCRIAQDPQAPDRDITKRSENTTGVPANVWPLHSKKRFIDGSIDEVNREVIEEHEERALTYLSIRALNDLAFFGNEYSFISIRSGSQSRSLLSGGLRLSPAPTRRRISTATLRPHFNINSGCTTTRDTAQLWHGWLKTCSKTHTRCREIERKLQAFTPKRLIRLLPNNSRGVSKWKLVISDIANVPYLTLSHCWGSHQPTQLTSDRLHEFLQPSSVRSLPKTYQHAIDITNALKFQYIWIDSLCIVQDDEEDWRVQSKLMGSIYRNAACNIAATWAANSSDGCFSYRDPNTVKPCMINLDLAHNGSSTYQISNPRRYGEEVLQAPLNLRGWVVQERYLARRQLNFTKNQVHWECYELIASEELLAGIQEPRWGGSAIPLVEKPKLDFPDELDFRHAWKKLIEHYSSCQLSRQSDKLYAISGLATELERLTGGSYIAGLWKTDLYKQLCWSFDFSHSNSNTRKTTSGCIAPTWSWANVNGPIRYSHAYTKFDSQIISWIRAIEMPEKQSERKASPTIVKQRLKLKGVAIWGCILPTENRAKTGTSLYKEEIMVIDPIRALRLPDFRRISMSIYWDDGIPPATADPDRKLMVAQNRNTDLLFLFVLEDQRNVGIEGLVLRRLPLDIGQDEGIEGLALPLGIHEHMEYVRMGSFEVRHTELELFLGYITTRLGFAPKDDDYPEDFVATEDVGKFLNLDDPMIADVVHVVTVV